MANSAPIVLAVDDDPDVLMIASTVLSEQGFTVLEAVNGAEALKVIEARPDIDLLFTDIVMPGDIDGFELAHQAKQLRPALRVVYTSGYMKKVPWGDHGVGHGPLLQKPWRQGQLIQTILTSLQGGGEPSTATNG